VTGNYVERIAGDLALHLPDCDTDLLQLYALLALVKGTETTLTDVHDAWSIWRTQTRPEHPSIVPFNQLTGDVQQLDLKYAEAIRDVAHVLELDAA
jgi:hypothetical protein